MKSILTHYNRKYGKDIYNFPLPISTCEFKTENCKKFCYVKRIWYNVLPRYVENLKQTFKARFTRLVINQIRDFEIQYIRIHTIGDFYSEEYYNKWVEIAKKCPGTRILVFTRNTILDFSNHPDNLVIYFSKDESTKEINKTCDHFGLAFDPPQIRRYYDHMEKLEEGNLKIFICSNRCANCKACFSGKITNIAFPIVDNKKSYKKKDEKSKIDERFIDPYNLGGMIHKPRETWYKYTKKKEINNES